MGVFHRGVFQEGDRRGFLRAGLDRWVQRLVEETTERVTPAARTPRQRPPGALPELGFLAACTRCGECAKFCPPEAIRLAPGEDGLAAGTPYIDPRLQPCTACPDLPCVEACPTGALSLADLAAGWRDIRLGEVEFHPERCVAFQGVACGVCATACPVGPSALALDDEGRPVLRREGCVGCGVCVRACITAPSSFDLTCGDQ
jgi:MauM/NapG family ferredoxin protein